MASNNIVGGQTALIGIPEKSDVGQMLDLIPLPEQVKMTSIAGKKKSASDNGIDASKVTENGKRQARRIAISDDCRILLVSSEKVGMRKMFKKKTDASDSYNKIEISSIDRIIRGQLTRKFLTKTKIEGHIPNIPAMDERISLSILFRTNTASTQQIAEEEGLSIVLDSTDSWGSLDLIISSQKDYDVFVQTLQSLIDFHRTYKMSTCRDLLLLQQNWMSFGKNMDDRIRQGEWTTLCCDRLSAPVKRSSVVSLYRKFCNAASTKPEDGITLPKAVGLLEHVRKLSLHMENKVDPCDVIWNILLQYNIKYENSSAYDSDNDESEVDKKRRKRGSSKYETITAAAFLKFIRSQQKDSRATIQQVKNLFERLNSISTASQVTDDGVTKKEEYRNNPVSRKRITKAVFFNFILSDYNDAFDPDRGQWEQDDMTQPICSYWINSSHDTYLSDVPPCMLNNKFDMDISKCPMDVKMYASALYRGCRCLDFDVWDGESIQKGQPVIRLDTASNSNRLESSSRPKSHDNDKADKKGGPIIFSDILWVVRSFLNSNPETLPILLFIENHCCLTNQEKMAEDISNIFGKDKLVYIPQGGEGKTLPSPDEMRGKAVIKFKIVQSTQSAVFDDHDIDNDINPYVKKTKDTLVHKDEEEIQAYGLDTVGSIISDTPHNHEKSPLELQTEAGREAKKSRAAANEADEESFKAKIKANRAREFAEGLLVKAGMTTRDADKELRRLAEKMNPSSQYNSKSKSSPGANVINLSILSEENYYPEDDDTLYTNDYTVDQDTDKDNGFMTRIREWGQCYLGSSSHESEEHESMHDQATVSVASSRWGGRFDERSEISKKGIIYESREDLSPKGHSVEEGEDWIDSTPEFRRYLSAKKKKREIEDQKDVAAVERKIHGIIEHKEIEGIEVEHFFSSTVDHAIIGHGEAEKKKLKAAEILSVATELVNKCKKEFEQANKELQKAKTRRDKASRTSEFAKHDADERKNNAEKVQSEMTSLKEIVEKNSKRLNHAVVAVETAASEARKSEARAVEAEKGAKRAQAAKSAAATRAKYEAKMENEAAKSVATEKRVYKEVSRNYKNSQHKWEVIVEGLEKVKRQIKDIESSPQYYSEQKDAELGNLEGVEGKMRRKHKMKVDEQFSLEDKLHKAVRDKKSAEEKKRKAKKFLEEAERVYEDQRKRSTGIREEADNATKLAVQQAEDVDEEREVARIRQLAHEKAENSLQKIQAQLTRGEIDLQNAERETEEAVATAQRSQANVKKSHRNVTELEDLDKYLERVEKKRKKLRSAKKAYKKAYEAHDCAEENWDEARNVLNKNADVYYKAKIDASLLESRANAAQSLSDNALSAYERSRNLAKAAEIAKENATACRGIAAERAAEYRHAQDYTKKKALIHPISMKLSNMTLLHSVKFRYFEKSKVLPFNHLHSLSEGKVFQLCKEGDYEMNNLNEFNKTHMTRVFPSKHKELRSTSNNYNPVLAWSLGCQIVSLNQQICDDFVLVNDGRFRVNGSCGYVLKPESMIERKGGDISRRNHSDANYPRRWNIKILSGYNLPKPYKKALTESINPRVRLTLYDGGYDISPTVHTTEIIQKNGMNPIWDENEGGTFNVKDPSTAVILYSVWDVDESTRDEDFIGAAAIPISCMRQGYRSIPLFDANHKHCGSHGYTMLLVRIEAN